MSKICPKCNSSVDESLILCPKCKSDFSDKSSAPLIDPILEKAIVNKVFKKMVKSMIGGFSLLTLISLVAISLSFKKVYTKAKNQVEENVSMKIKKEFETERITNTIKDAANEEAAKVIEIEFNPLINLFKENTETILEQTQTKINKIEKQFIHTIDEASPVRLLHHSTAIARDGDGFKALITFKTSKIGKKKEIMESKARITDYSDAKLTYFLPKTDDENPLLWNAVNVRHKGRLSNNMLPNIISYDGKEANFSYSLGKDECVVIELKVTSQANVIISGNLLKAPLDISFNEANITSKNSQMHTISN